MNVPPVSRSDPLPDITVVIPCYNREDTVEAAVRSVLDQDYAGAFAVIAVDDGSTDRTREVLETITDPRLSVMSNTGSKGACGSRNTGAFAGQGAWIAFQDSDDLWLPGKLTAQMAQIARWSGDRPCIAAYCGMEIRGGNDPDSPIIDRVPNADRPAAWGDIVPELIWTSLISTQTLVVRRDVFEAVGGFDPDMPALQDWDLMLRVAPRGDVAFVDETLVVQRMSGNSITKSAKKRVDAQMRLLGNHRDIWQAYPQAQAHHYHRIAGGYRRLGQFKSAADAAAEAARLSPKCMKYKLNSAYLRALAFRAQHSAGQRS